MQITIKIFRYNPEQDKKPHYQSYKVPAEPTDRVLDILEYIKGNFDGTLSFRRSCAHGICGSDAMRINGRNYLACKVLVKDLHSSKITVEPIMGMRVIKDLIVDMEPFFEHYRSVKPYLVNDEPAPPQERLQSEAEHERFDDTTKCILCAAAPPPAPPSGLTTSTSARPPSSPPTASSSTVATTPPPSACAS
jgi:succinate dehydrogenase / fumarate reductase iron-sulfur subunit